MKLKYISWLPAAFFMFCIFAFSSKPAETSNESSLTIANKVLAGYEAVTGHQYDGVDREDKLEIINHIVRKGAHFSEYALLACTIAFHLLVCRTSRKWLILLPILISSLYAMTDEYHQTFVAGRSGRITDVMIDSSGAVTGTLLFLVLIASGVYKHRKNTGNLSMK